MTTTPQQQAASSALQIIQTGNNVLRVLGEVKKTLAEGKPANVSLGLPGFTPSELAAALGAENLAVIEALVSAIPSP